MNHRKNHKSVFSCLLGNILELYDYIIYGALSGIITNQFFPTSSKQAQLLIAFLVFASSCITRPVGAILFGYIGDKYGRRIALAYSVLSICMATSIISILPTYNQIGTMACILLVVARLLQGISMCGEETGAAIFLSEVNSKNRIAFSCSLVIASVFLGLALATFIAYLFVTFIPKPFLLTTGWRIPFLLPLIPGIIAFYLRLKEKESGVFLEEKLHNSWQQNPVLSAVRYNYKQIIRSFFLTALMSVMIYVYVIFIPFRLNIALGYESSVTTSIMLISFIFTCILTIFVGFLSDLFNESMMLKIASIFTIIFIYPSFALINASTKYLVLLGIIFLGFLTSLTAGSFMGVLVKSFRATVRYTGVSLAFNMSMAIFGGTAPILCLYLEKQLKTPNAPAYYLIGIALLTLFLLRKKNNSWCPQENLTISYPYTTARGR